ncbi:Haloacid Dehalogenase Superfamily Class (subfamily) IIA [Amycolatopsis arida]|uniref:Haloacid Dehalogenase Superfamily Class (Subfamily) IIA n=1 Tax=Amycolatopsis arida TaxID=587909 RepID=A0A1I6AXT3_9PSEU|nr:HAD-IIA family hydrolase [Amycolatopsis arida]TDX85344.1 HAD superfamily hydrolase (TIGR01450 family) [Amycolatopsis arida]SFQ73439.1 Haloacid Dehalogenase Superfamily Class (subfamily) IIA [Amycolatopsis arida]
MTSPTERLLDRHDAVLLDLDGTVYHGATPVPGATDVLDELRRRGTPLRFVTNNAAKAPDAVTDHLRALGVRADPAEVSTSAQAAARLLGDRLPAGAVVLVVGTDALAAEVKATGLTPVRAAGPEVAAVIQGYSKETAWPDLAEACLAIRAGALWVACNLDATVPTERGQLPGNGSFVAALRTATGAEPVVAGKPEPPLFRLAADAVGARDPIVVGDRLDTDIAGAVATGFPALAVLTGVATPAALLAAPPEQRPRYVAADLTGLTAPAADLEIGPRPGWRVDPGTTALSVAAAGDRAEPLDLLRALCAAAWDHGVTVVEPADEHARAALVDLKVG